MSENIKSFRDVWQFPLKQRWSKVFDAKSNMVFDFMNHFCKDFFKDEGKEVTVISEEQRNNIVNLLNGDKKGWIANVTHEKGMICVDGKVLILIRGWGYLTGCGGLNLEPEKAAALQDELANFIVSKLSKEQAVQESDTNKAQ